MKLFYIFLLFVGITFSSCKTDRKPSTESKPAETPQAFQEDNGSTLLSKKRFSDVVEDLYAELVEKNSALSALENGIEKIKDDSKDSGESFKLFDSRNDSYYSSANSHLNSIKDSILKERTRQLIDNSLAKYKTKITPHNDLIAAIDAKNITLNDLHIVLKLSKTLSVIENFQNADLPSTKPLESINKGYDKIISLTDSLSKK